MDSGCEAIISKGGATIREAAQCSFFFLEEDMRVGVIGAGSWGTTLANMLAGKGFAVELWAWEADLVERMAATRENDVFLPGITLHDDLGFTADLRQAAAGKDLVLFVCPSHVMRAVVSQIAAVPALGTLLVSAAKGIENDTLMTMDAVLAEVLPPELHAGLAVLSGPSFAREVARGLPTAVVAAAADAEVARRVQEICSTARFRIYTNNDMIGVELGGALKNVMAIAAGVADGLGFGANARAALITRGLAEMTRLGVAMGARRSTFAGLAGMGDLVLTATGDLSRNRTLGLELAGGRRLNEILAAMKMIAEGVKTTLSAWQLAVRHGVEVPIIEQMHAILYHRKDPREAVNDLLARELKPEEY
jgi:glycerol-3-phosphate dehydrogenase (NAD(P)+)